MLKIKSVLSFVFVLLFVIQADAQKKEDWIFKNIDSAWLPRLNATENVLGNPNSLNQLFTKLYKIKHFSKENAVFVHIGDSHIQADIETAVIRNEFQLFYGNAGRGLIFPFQVAKTNAPSDIISSSRTAWKSNRVTKADTLTTCGISAFGIQSQSSNPEFTFELRTINGYRDSFDRVKLFMSGKVSELFLEYNDMQAENACYTMPPNYAAFDLNNTTSGFKLTFPTTDNITFYGASIEKKDACGIIYHSIGANGAKYSDFNKTPRFWKQLKYLNADCYIVSLGTNEAQDPNLTSDSFLVEVKTMVNKLHAISPNASIILTTPPVSFFKKHFPNQSLVVITNALIDYCIKNNLVYWDLFGVSKGLEGAKIWKLNQLLRPDLVHFSREGYTLQGNLFVDAFVKSWNEFLCKNH